MLRLKRKKSKDLKARLATFFRAIKFSYMPAKTEPEWIFPEGLLGWVPANEKPSKGHLRTGYIWLGM